MASPARQRRAQRHGHQLDNDTRPVRRGSSPGVKEPITAEAVVDAALSIVTAQGYDALTMRKVAAALETGPASIYAHVVDKRDLDDLLIGRLCSEIDIPTPSAEAWRSQIVDVCTQLRRQYEGHPGISQAAMALVPTNIDALRVGEGMLGILLTGGIDARTAAWLIEALLLYVNAFCLRTALRDKLSAANDGWALTREESLKRFEALPDTYPYHRQYAVELTCGSPNDRFEFVLNQMLADPSTPRNPTDESMSP